MCTLTHNLYVMRINGLVVVAVRYRYTCARGLLTQSVCDLHRHDQAGGVVYAVIIAHCARAIVVIMHVQVI